MNSHNPRPAWRTWLTRLPILAYLAYTVGIAGAQTITVGTGTLTATGGTNGNPIYRSGTTSTFHFSKSVHLYKASDLVGMTGGSTITQFGWYKTDVNTLAGANTCTFNIYMKNSAAATLASGTAWSTMTSGATLVYSGTAPPAAAVGYWDLTLTTPFLYTGGSLEVYADWVLTPVASPYSTGAFGWQYSSATAQSMGTSFGSAIPGTQTTYTVQARMYNARITFSSSPCAGTPTPGNTTGPASVCPGAAFSLGLQNPTIGSGVAYQWYASTDGGTTYNPVGPNSGTYPTTQTVPTMYYCDVTCTEPGGGTASSTPITVGVNTFYTCYCASGATSTIDEEIYAVTFNGTTIGDVTPGAGNTGCTVPAPGPGSILSRYSNWVTGPTPHFSITQGLAAAFTVQEDECNGATYYAFGTAIWIDYNQDGVFDNTTEKVFVEGATLIGPRNVTGSITAPYSSLLGVTGMRVTIVEGGSGAGLTSCMSYSYGETEDFLVEILPSTACAGTPTPGNTTGPASVCPGGAVALGLQNLTTGTGVTYQWYASTDGGSTFNPVGTSSPTFGTTQTVPTIYYCDVTCTEPGGGTGSSAQLSVGINAFYTCYCASGAGITADEEIFSVTLNGATVGDVTPGAGNTGCTIPAPGPGSQLSLYSNWITTPTPHFTITQGVPAPFSVQEDECDGATYYAFGTAIWIDYNQDGVFDDLTEKAFVEGATLVGPRNVTGSINAPFTSLTGLTGMRVTIVEGGSGAGLTSCLSYNYGETEDFLVQINAGSPCAGTPAPGNTTGPSAACPSANFSLGLQNYTGGSGVTYQWESADDAAFTVNVQALGTSDTQVTSQTSAKYYRCLVTCTVSGLSDYSTPLLVTMGDACLCGAYCVVTNFGDGACITGVQINTLVSTTAACVPNPGYTLRTETTTLMRGLSYPITVDCNSLVYGGAIVSVWFDWNNNQVFEASEWFQPYTSGTTGSVTVLVPMSAVTGTIRMRVRSRGQGNTNGAGDGCLASMGSGTCEDFCITLIDPPACDAPPAASATSSTLSSACAGTNFTLSLATNYGFTGITYQWQSADDAAFTTNVQNLGTATTQVSSLTTASQYFRCVIECTNPGGGITYSTPALVTLVSDLCVCGTYPAVYASSTADEDLAQVTVGSLSNGSTCATLAPGPGSILNRYSNYTGALPAPQLSQGTSVSFSLSSITCGGTYGNGFKIYIDWNQDGDWADAGEEVHSSAASTSGPWTDAGSFTVPLTATLGITRMRAVVVETTFPNTTNYTVTAYSWGEAEDYCVEVVPPPVPASATASIIDDCNAQTYTIDVNVANFGSGGSANIIYQLNAGPDVIVPAVIGSNTLPTAGSFSQLDVVSIQIDNGTIAELDMGDFFGGCPIEVPCGSTLTVDHCYGNNDPRVFIFIADDPGRDLVMTFIAGTMDPNDVIRTYEGTDENFSPSITFGSFANLGAPQLTITSNTDTLMLIIDSDGSNSCQDAQQTSWQFEVECLAPCADPDGTAVYDICTQTITANLDFDGSGTTATIRYIVNGGTPVDLSGLNAPYSTVLGPFSTGDAVQVLLINDDDPECTRNLGTTTILAVPAPPTVIASATPTVVCPSGSSQLQATAVAPTPPAVPGYVFEEFVGSYTPITGGVVYGTATSDDQRFVDPAVPAGGTTTTGVGLPIGFSFTYNGVVYDRLAINNNGWISFGSSLLTPSVNIGSTSSYTPLSSTTVTTPTHLRNRVAAFGSDLQAQAGATLRLETIGTAPNRVCVIQWENYKRYSVTGHTLNFQIRLYEGTNFVEVHYGSMVWTATTYTAHVGLGGNVATQFNNRTTTTNWNSTTAGGVNSASCTWNTAATYPTVGRVFRWRSPEIAGAAYSWTAPTNLDNAFIANPIATVPATETFTVSATGTSFPCPGSAMVTVTVNPPITAASITPAAPDFCTGSSVTLTAVPADGVAPFTYQWYDPSNNPMGTAVTQAANIVGTWSCLITDNCGGTVTPTVAVTSTETPVLNVTPDLPTCAGYNIVLTANTVSGTPNSWLWSGPAPAAGQTTQSITLNDITSASNGSYSVVASFNGCPSAPAAYVLTANPSPAITSLTADPISVCDGQNSVLSVTATLPSGAYCTPIYTTGCTFPDVVSNVTFAGINRTGGPTPLDACDALTATGYSNLASPQGNVVAGGTYPISVTTDGDDENLSVWIDYNRNGTFDATELVLQRLTVTVEPQTTTGNVTIPLTAFNGPTRMRVRCVYGTTFSAVNPCTSTTFGETEDYVINITGGVDQLVYAWTGGSFLGGIDNTPSVTADNIAATTTYNVLVTSLGCTDTENVTVYYGTNDFTFEVRTDANGGQTAYSIYEQGTNTLMFQVPTNTFPNNAIATSTGCLPDGCYYLVVTDGGGDGIVGGGYALREGTGNQRRLIDNMRDQYGYGGFTSGGTSTIAGGEGFCLPMGDDRLIYTSTDKMDWRTSPCGGEYVVADDNDAVSAEYGGPNAATSGYQMWWYNPNGGYSFKRYQSHNTANGLPASATRACHFKANGWAGNQLVDGTFYNVKVRGRVAGNYLPWGAASRFRIDNTGAQCPRTKLMDIPDNPFLSCGQSRAIGNTVNVHARPVKRMNANCTYTNANRYQFRFRIPAEFVTIVKTSAVGQYWVNTSGLTCGKTYEVDVRASFDGGSNWCHTSDPYGDVCMLTTTCSFGMAEEPVGGPMESRFAMYPNPNRGDQVMLSIGSVEEGVETVSVDLYDSYGKRAITRVIAVQDGFVNTLIDLNGELANGLYLVSITAGSQAYQERLVIQK